MTKPDATLSTTDKLLGVLGYISFFCILTLVLGKNKFTQFHGKQGLVITLVFFILSGAATFISYNLGKVVGFLYFVIAIIGIVHAAQGKTLRFPFVGDMADKLDFEGKQ